MRKVIVTALLTGHAFCGLAADETMPQVVLPQKLEWASPPNNSTVHGAWVLGAEKESKPYILRVRLSAGGKITPHTHPDERNSTVLSGTLYVGFGKTFDASKVIAVPAGGVYVAPANVPHFVWAKDGEVVYQEAGVGPTATSYAGGQ